MSPELVKKCFVCKDSKDPDAMVQIGAKMPIFKHSKCDHTNTCYVCGEEVTTRSERYKETVFQILDGVRIMGGYVRHNHCETGSMNWYFNPASEASEFRGLFAHHDQRREEKMAQTKESIGKKIKRNKNLTDKQKEIKDLIGRVKYFRYMDKNPNTKVDWTVAVPGMSVEHKAGEKTVTLKVKGQKAAKITPDKAIAELEIHLSNESAK